MNIFDEQNVLTEAVGRIQKKRDKYKALIEAENNPLTIERYKTYVAGLNIAINEVEELYLEMLRYESENRERTICPTFKISEDKQELVG